MSDEDEEEGAGEGGGEGKEIYPYGEYEGGRDDQLDRHGFGSALLPNGDIYEGEYRHGKRHGKGMYCFKNGARYTGSWRKGLKHGKGEFLYPDGTRYVGDWKKDLKHGQGTYNYINGDTYEGCWYKGWRYGLGTYTYKAVNVTHYGTWKDGRMEGPGILNYPYYRFHGKFLKNLPKGAGCFTFDAKYMLHGYYINMRDPAFDYVGAEELELNRANPDVEDRSNPRVPVLVHESEESLLDIMEYLQKQFEMGDGMEEENRHVPSPVPEELLLDLPDVDLDII
ncbi:hypothetical protein NQ314_005297 [Rhamnusium bicolor]|uniref:Radial spoke head 1 homolog n=1 Tax=Rhamnusium bicolor TaxID=1586634 RepID=A0AAV8ZIN7_9CUCU|nr:hypothetical protein NQ314_005297 [Rhamnusium bicolor]